MFFGKFALIAYIFSAGLLGVIFLMTTAGFGGNAFQDIVTTPLLDSLLGFQNVQTIPIDLALPFGNFYGALNIIGKILFGGIVNDTIQHIPFLGAGIGPFVYVISIFYSFSTLCLVINILTGRDL